MNGKGELRALALIYIQYPVNNFFKIVMDEINKFNHCMKSIVHIISFNKYLQIILK